MQDPGVKLQGTDAELVSKNTTWVPLSVSLCGWQVEEMLNAGFFDMKDYAEGGWVTALKYESEVIDELKQRTNKDTDKPLDKPLKTVHMPMSLSLGDRRCVMLGT